MIREEVTGVRPAYAAGPGQNVRSSSTIGGVYADSDPLETMTEVCMTCIFLQFVHYTVDDNIKYAIQITRSRRGQTLLKVPMSHSHIK